MKLNKKGIEVMKVLRGHRSLGANGGLGKVVGGLQSPFKSQVVPSLTDLPMLTSVLSFPQIADFSVLAEDERSPW